MAPPVTCSCGSCAKCKSRTYMRDWYARQSGSKKRAISQRVYSAAKAAGKANKPAGDRKVQARSAARTVAKRACANCGSTTNVQAHHTNYARPTAVRFLCAKCHGKTQRG